MQVDLILNDVKPFSINGAYTRNVRYKTNKYTQWKKTVMESLQLPVNKTSLDKLKDSFDPQKHALYVTITVNYPETQFFVQGKKNQGAISARTMDLTNTEKLLIDLIFTKTLELDDRYISDLKSEKRPSEGFKTLVRISLIPINSLS